MSFNVYRYDIKKFSYIKPLYLLERDKTFFKSTKEFKERVKQLRERFGTLYTEDYIRTVFVFPYELTKEHIEKLKANGFNKWNNVIYELIFDVDKRENRDKVKFCYLLSEPNIQKEIDAKWDSWKRENQKLWTNEKGIVNPDLFYAAKLLFFNSIYQKYGLRYPDDLDTVLDFVKSQNYDVDALVDYNIQYGDKNQFATYLPHLGLRVIDEEEDGFEVDDAIKLFEDHNVLDKLLEVLKI
jgi:hypothetical protein